MKTTKVASGIILVDISDILPRHKTKRYRKRSKPISRHFFHHSGRPGKPGFAGVRNMVRYCVEHRGWPGSPYTYWIPYFEFWWWDFLEEISEMRGIIQPENDGTIGGHDLVYFRCQSDELRTYHTGGLANSTGVATAFQGNTTIDGLSESQIEITEAHIPFVGKPISWHSEADRYGGKRKPSCPGRDAEKWLKAYREKM